MSQHPSDPYRTPQTAPPARSLPRRDMRDTNRGPFTPPDTALTSQRPQQSLELAQRYELLNRLGVPPVANEDFDELARDMTTQAGFLYGFVNLFLEEHTLHVMRHQKDVGLRHPQKRPGQRRFSARCAA